MRETRRNCESNTVSDCAERLRWEKGLGCPRISPSWGFSAGPADAGRSRGLVEPVRRFRTIRAEPAGTGCREDLPAEETDGPVGRVALLTRELHRKHFKINGLGNSLFNGSAAVLYLTASGLKGLLYVPSSVSHPVLNTCLSCAQSTP